MVEAHFSQPLFTKLQPAILTILSASLAIYLYNVVPSYIIGLTRSSFGRTLYQF